MRETPQKLRSDQAVQSLLSQPGTGEQIFSDLLEMMGFLVMERLDAARFQIFGRIPEWFNQLFDMELSHEATLALEELSPFVENFATIAEQFWSESASGTLKSGPWTHIDQSGVERHLELSAVNLGGRKIMLVQLLGEDYHKKKDLLQRFREKGLDYEILFKTQQALNRAHDLLRKQAAKLKELSLVDPLTGLNNRRGFFTLAEHQIKIADSTNSTLVLLYMDLNNFKQINDTLGHAEGDNVLVATADLFRKTFRRSDIISRFGGDEFVVLVTDESDASEDLLRRRLEKNISEFNSNPSLNYKLSTSVGIAVWRPDNPCTLEELLSQSDNSMYQDKKRMRELL
jgi:diguanylate cyclase (GGDEF)-like protein